MKIIFDLDHTLFDTALFMKVVIDEIRVFGVSDEEARASVSAYLKSHGANYDLDDHLRELGMASDVIKKKFDDLRSYLRPGARELLEKLSSEGHELFLLTKGIHVFQYQKAERSDILPFFKEIYVVERDKGAILKSFSQTEDIWFINDHWQETEELMSCFPHVKYVLFVRPDAASFYDPKTISIANIKNLSELTDLFLRYKKTGGKPPV